MPRFVVLRHQTPDGLHWDLMIEHGEALRTWSLPEPPRLGESMPARSLADHRAAYLDYEGPVSGGRGTVSRWDSGSGEVLACDGAQWHVRLTGVQFIGEVLLTRSDAEADAWTCVFR